MKIVKFADGKWALRRFSVLILIWVYKDLATDHNFWWPRSSMYFRDCLANSEEEVRSRAKLTKVERKVKI